MKAAWLHKTLSEEEKTERLNTIIDTSASIVFRGGAGVSEIFAQL